ncbi:hypothetical protein CBR_g46896 [Chara braunii]|uniref:Uncharacterized protein n=1 Tax=Chara braunii TaxID=69332 RepID=A0A388M1H6_CHABU|nr:hypothetical protein CBR_g46896 [Chara braunii]|eukprot:GBG88329.1 hypothetical protein CBR_g46896 [Chara braunii]
MELNGHNSFTGLLKRDGTVYESGMCPTRSTTGALSDVAVFVGSVGGQGTSRDTMITALARWCENREPSESMWRWCHPLVSYDWR